MVNPTVKSSFWQASLRILKHAATKELSENRNTRDVSSSRESTVILFLFLIRSLSVHSLRLCFLIVRRPTRDIFNKLRERKSTKRMYETFVENIQGPKIRPDAYKGIPKQTNFKSINSYPQMSRFNTRMVFQVKHIFTAAVRNGSYLLPYKACTLSVMKSISSNQ